MAVGTHTHTFNGPFEGNVHIIYMAVGDMDKNLVKIGLVPNYGCRLTHRQTCSSQYFAPLSAEEQ